MLLGRLCVNDAFAYRCHDIRRGHANDMLQRGRSLYEILMAGEWRSPAFMSYLDMCELERGAVVEAHADESSSDDEDIDALACMRAKCLHRELVVIGVQLCVSIC